MHNNIRLVSTYPPRKCGVGTFSRDLATALEHFTAEVGHIRVAAIDNGSGPYGIPVDLVIDQFNPESWQNAITHICTRAGESQNRTIVLLQHEYGLDPADDGTPARGHHYVDMARAFRKKGLTTLVYLHTVLNDPDTHQKKILQELAAESDGLIVTTESAIDILESDVYQIPHLKLKHIDHGIRMQHRTHYDRLAIKRDYGLENHFQLTTLGLLSPGKGVQYGIRAYGRFVQTACSEVQRWQMVYLIAGQCHPEFVKADGGSHYQHYMQELKEALEESGLTWCRVHTLTEVDYDGHDVVFFDGFLDDTTLVRLYAATNVMLLPYLNMQQISSGILADTLGSGRVAVATKFMYARELIHSNKPLPEGMYIGRYVRGILVDPGEPSVEQIAKALDYLVFNEGKRLRMEKQAHQRGYQMRWQNTAWALLQHIEFLQDRHEHRCGRGPVFEREKVSVYQRHMTQSHEK